MQTMTFYRRPPAPSVVEVARRRVQWHAAVVWSESTAGDR